MTKQEKMELLEKLVKEGHITLAQAFGLLESEKENPALGITGTCAVSPANSVFRFRN